MEARKINKILDNFYKKQKGGHEEKPNGGFLPIYVCGIIKEEISIKREYSSPTNTVSMKDLIEQRKKLAQKKCLS